MNYQQQIALEVLQKGGVIAYPTDTTFGIGCNIIFEESIERIRTLKQRDAQKPMSIACCNLEMAERYADFSLLHKDLMAKLFPGPVTLLLPKTDLVSNTVTSGSNKVGIRIPDFPDILEVIKVLRHPIITTSANLSGEKDPTASNEIKLDVDYIYPGECTLKMPSTIIDIELKKVVREGADAQLYTNIIKSLT